MYQVNDAVLYGTDGVCFVKAVEKMKFGAVAAEYYVLEPAYSENAAIYVPLKNEKLVEKMRPVLSAAEIHEIIQKMPNEDGRWIEDETERKATFSAAIAGGNRRELVRMIKALYLHQTDQQAKGRRLHTTDERYFKEAEKLLYDEIALVLKLEPDRKSVV